MQLDIRLIPTNWATIEKNTDRHRKMGDMFRRLEMRNTVQMNGPISDPYTIGIAQTHIKGMMGLLPVLVLEDDCQVIAENWRPIIEVPEGTDALYLGSSWFGMVRGRSQHRGCISSSFNEDYNRVYNMLGIHSIIYLTESYRDKVVELLTEFVNNPVGGCDECIASEMKNHLILAVKKPMFYQNDGHSEEETMKPLEAYF